MEIVLWTLVGFLSGSVPYSVLIGRAARGVDIRTVGDRNPGAANVIRSSGAGWGALAILLDALKGTLPVGLAWYFWNVRGIGIVPIALAPVLGHAFTPWLKFKGGKAVSTTFGVWAGLTLWVVPTLFGLLLGLGFALLRVSGWAVTLAFFLLGGFVVTYFRPTHPEFIWLWGGNLLLLVWKHWDEISGRPELRPNVVQWLQGRRG